ncbi:unnamed protein product [Macrosiphum euphorbiae]|uniref:DDE Tnp4 domain-containing protein n=1 Tax=Macrosiphum euphorbiae TaxID=13131 RepID=A0AAV0XQY7_9HEMI|nr:unnamed protein product [Macrosiphum euphorbiae]
MDNSYEHNMSLYRLKIIIICALQSIKNRQRKWHVKPIFKERKIHGDYYCLIKDYQINNSALFYNYMRMTSTAFEELIIHVGPFLQRIPTRPDTLSVGACLTATIRYMASGESMVDLSYSFRIGHTTVSKLILGLHTRATPIYLLFLKVLKVPRKQDWQNISHEFPMKWNSPNCCGALDGKHVVHQAVSNSGSSNYNYKGTHSIVLLALCDANYNFKLVDIWSPGRCSDGGIFKNSVIGKSMLSESIDFPKPVEIDNVNGPIPFHLVADESFTLLTNFKRPFPGRGKHNLHKNHAIFNYRLSRSRRTIENTFGIMSSKWRIFRRPIIASEKTVNAIIEAAVVYKNLRKWKVVIKKIKALNYKGNIIQFHNNVQLFL